MVDIILIPSCPAPSVASPAMVSFVTEMTGPLGGPTQRVPRIGSRWRIDFEYPPMTYGDGRQFLSRLNRAELSPVAIAFPQRGLRPLSPGPLAVNGAATTALESNAQLVVRGGIPGVELVDGQFFHVASGGRRWVHQLVGDVILDGSGAGVLGVVPLLRFAPADGDLLEFVAPLLEGFVTLGWNWTIEMLNRVGLRFSVVEDR
jgi:hypothetical protein